jgi:hypothetical protein
MTSKIQIIDNGIYIDRRLVAEIVADLPATLKSKFIALLENEEDESVIVCNEQLLIPLEDK